MLLVFFCCYVYEYSVFVLVSLVIITNAIVSTITLYYVHARQSLGPRGPSSGNASG